MRAFRFPTLRWASVLLLVTGLGIWSACDTADADGDAGQIRLLLTDAPGDLVSAFVTIDRVELIGDVEDDFDGESEDGRYILLLDEPFEVDLLTLQDGVTTELADTDLPDGDYRQIRLIVGEDAFVVLEDGTEMDLKVPSGTQTGIKIPLPPITVDEEGDLVVLTVDFDVEQSFVQRGNSGMGYIFKPVLHPERLLINGEEIDLSGFDD